MSGGSLSDYKEYNIEQIADSINDIIWNNKKLKSKEDICPWDYDSNGEVYEYSKYYYNFSDETIKEFEKAVRLLKEAYIYAHRIDWLISGDDGEDTFHKRLQEDLKELYNNKIFKSETDGQK